MPKILTVVADRSTEQSQVTKIQQFIAAHNLGSNKKLATALSDAEFNLKWSKRNVATIKDYVQQVQWNGAATFTTSWLVFLGAFFIAIFSYL